MVGRWSANGVGAMSTVPQEFQEFARKKQKEAFFTLFVSIAGAAAIAGASVCWLSLLL
eukprot:CAMPEP_0115116298 /NCGR_PEP_ID=MMETSP0227-20121206/43202_1 /TAXON_ID=89957 /ORGANISM="Polarella glacialis, Strain CCMP 1383" /LENGTH=57 /DNA_ID=CAMNT_0002517129 /DNA_START=260 /DNA_END=433 /DNA_ORIENTATION=-